MLGVWLAVDIDMLLIERIHSDRMQGCGIGWRFLRATQPLGAIGVQIETIDAPPRHTVVVGTKQIMRRRPSAPDLRFAGVAQ